VGGDSHEREVEGCGIGILTSSFSFFFFFFTTLRILGAVLLSTKTGVLFGGSTGMVFCQVCTYQQNQPIHNADICKSTSMRCIAT